jgi:hypothetical protein
MRTLSKMLLAAIFCAFAVAPAMAQTVTVDYDHSINFLKFKSYKLVKVHATDPGVEDRLTIAIDRDLQSRYLHTEDTNPDLLVAVVEVNTDTSEYKTFYGGLDGVSFERGWGPGGFLDGKATVGDIAAGTLVVDMWDGKTKKLIWRGTIAEPPSVTADKEADQKMDKAVGQVLGQFPPKFKKS